MSNEGYYGGGGYSDQSQGGYNQQQGQHQHSGGYQGGYGQQQHGQQQYGQPQHQDYGVGIPYPPQQVISPTSFRPWTD